MKKIGKKVIIQAPYIDQSVRYPTGCESVSAVMLLQYLGIDITVDGFYSNFMESFSVRTRENISAGARMMKMHSAVMPR